MTKPSTNGDTRPLGVFRPEELYTKSAVQRMTGWGEWTFRHHKNKSNGNRLRVLVVGKTSFVRGRDLIEFVEANAEET